MTFPFCISTWAGGWANLHSSSVLEHFPRWNSLQTSTSNHRGSLPMTGTIIFGMSPSGVSWSVKKYLPRRGGNHEWKKFLYAKADDANTVFPIFLAVRGILYLATKSCACSLSQKQRGLKLHNNESSITCRGQGHGASEIRMIFWLESRKMIKRCQFHEFSL